MVRHCFLFLRYIIKIMIKPNVISFLSKLEAEKLPLIISLSIDSFKGKDYLNIHSVEYKKISFYIHWLLISHCRYIFNGRTKAKFWLCYEYEKPYLWSVVDEDFIENLFYYIFSSITTKDIDGFLLYLYTDLCQRLKLNLEIERLSFNWVLNDNNYIDLITGKKQECDEIPSVYEFIKEKDLYDSYVVLDQNHLTLSVEEQISFVLSKLRNLPRN